MFVLPLFPSAAVDSLVSLRSCLPSFPLPHCRWFLQVSLLITTLQMKLSAVCRLCLRASIQVDSRVQHAELVAFRLVDLASEEARELLLTCIYYFVALFLSPSQGSSRPGRKDRRTCGPQDSQEEGDGCDRRRHQAGRTRDSRNEQDRAPERHQTKGGQLECNVHVRETGERQGRHIEQDETSQHEAQTLTRFCSFSVVCALSKKNGTELQVILVVLELATGGELFDFLAFTGPFEEAIARTYFQQLVAGLAHCHSKGIAHRDLKPENLLLDSSFVLKLADFGFANTFNSVQNVMYTECGTPGYSQ